MNLPRLIRPFSPQDEVFHVRQAQLYCAGRFHDWDPKITTPPGLYLLSYLFSFSNACLSRYAWAADLPLPGCSLSALRLANLAGLVLLATLLSTAYRLRNPTAPAHRRLFQHSAVNMTFFPPVFFFAALYYTDVWSTISVVLFYNETMKTDRMHVTALERYIRLVALGLFSLLFRQTNIFWVAIFPAALTLVQHLDRGHDVVRQSMYSGAQGFGDSLASVARTSWKMDVVFDPPVRDSWIDGTIGPFPSRDAWTRR